MRMVSYCDAINEALLQEMERDPNVFVYGLGVSDHKRVFGSTKHLVEKFKDRCFDTPLSEDAMTGFGLGAAINGLRPIHVHIRMDFLLLAMNQLANMVSSQWYVSNGKLRAPIVIRAIIGRGWGQGHQHSKSMYSVFSHIPGLKVVLPTTPADAKGLLISAIRDNNPVLVVEHRWLYWQVGEVSEEPFEMEIGREHLIREGSDVTVVALSWMNVEALKAAEILKQRYDVEVEIIDPSTISPLCTELAVNSIQKTGYCIIADNDWLHCGMSAEIATQLYEGSLGMLKSNIERIGFAPTPCPTFRHLENRFYPNAVTIIRRVEKMLKLGHCDLSNEDFYSHERRFKGPF